MKNITKVLIVLLCLVLVAFSVISCGKDPKETTGSADTTTVAPDETTAPETTEPEETDPEVTVPEETVPEETLPEETLPEETLPAETTPAETTKPAETTGEHKHDYTLITTYPKCTSDGVYTYICACGESYTEPGDPARGHSWKHVGTVESTCMVAGYDSYDCVVCGVKETRSRALLEHKFVISTTLVSVEEDPLGIGYEILACEGYDENGCSYMTKVKANHVAGHHFDVQKDGSIVCGCGATATESVETLGVNNATDTTTVAAPSFSVVDGKYWISGSSAQIAANASALGEYVQLLSQATNPLVSYSFDLFYENEVPVGYGSSGSDFFSWRDGTSEVRFFLTDTLDGKLTAFFGSNSVVLEEGEKYTFTVAVEPQTNRISLTVTGNFKGDGDTLVKKTVALVAPKDMANAASKFTGVFFGRKAFQCEDKDAFALYMDDITVTYVKREANEDNMRVEFCPHVFESVPFVDATHPSDEMWVRDTCLNCERFFERQDCELFGGHVWDLFITLPYDCENNGYEVYECLRCGEFDPRPVAKAHNYRIFAGVVSADKDPEGVGYELWSCPGCNELLKFEANHASGHIFDEDGVCNCGALEVPAKVNVGFDDFSSEESNITISSSILLGGELAISQENSQNMQFEMSKNEAFATLYKNHQLEDGTPIDKLFVSFDIKYTGDVTKISGGDINWRALPSGRAYYDEFTINLSKSGSQLALKVGGGEPHLMVDGESYRIVVEIDPNTEMLKVYLDGERVYTKKADYYDDFSKILLSRPALFCDKSEEFLLTIDNMSLDYAVTSVADATVMPDKECEHTFEMVESDREGMVKYECKDCKAKYYRQGDCESLGHEYEDLSYAATCEEDGAELFRCLYCGDLVEETIPSLGHDIPANATRVDEAACEQAGTEYFDCARGCGYAETKEIPALEHDWKLTQVFSQSDCTKQGEEEYTCQICGETRIETLPLGCAHVIFGGIVATADDPRGDGYELWICPGCNEAEKVLANHASGHNFEDGVCKCGATKTKVEYATVLWNDFENSENLTFDSTTMDFYRYNTTVIDGEWVLSKNNEQTSIKTAASPTLVSLLKGEYQHNGERVNNFTFAFDMYYTLGEGKKVSELLNKDDTLFSWRSAGGSQEVNLSINAKGDLLKIYNAADKNKLFDLEPNVKYTLTYHFDVDNKKIVVTINGGELDNVQLADKTATKALGEWATFFFRSKNVGYYDGSSDDFKLAVDNFVGSVMELNADETTMAPMACAKHAFELSEGDREGYVKYTCTECGCFYYDLSCETLGGHKWSDPEVTEAENCLEDSTKVTTCLVCGLVDIEAVSGPHNFNTLTQICTAEESLTGKGYEILGCAWCNAMKKIEANHASGHYFDEDGNCACGATAKIETVTGIITHDFTELTGTGSTWAAPAGTLENGKFFMNKTGGQPFLSKNNSNELYKMLLGEYNGNKVECVKFSIDISYTGNATALSGDLIDFRTEPAGASQNVEIGVTFVLEGDQVAITTSTRTSVNRVNTVKLEEGKDYKLTMYMIPETQTVGFTIAGDGIEETVLGELEKTKNSVSDFKIVIRGNAADKSKIQIYLDNLSVDYETKVADFEPEYDACEHNFSEEPVEGESDLYTYTCSECFGYYQGPKELKLQTIEVASLDFESNDSVGNAELNIANLATEHLVDSIFGGKAWKAMNSQQYFVRSTSDPNGDATKNIEITSIIKEGKDTEGNSVEAIDLSFDFFYTGSFKPTVKNENTNRVFMNYQTSSGTDAFRIYMEETADGEISAYVDKTDNGVLVLKANTSYAFSIHLDPEANNKVVVSVNDGNTTTVLGEVFAPKALNTFLRLGFMRNTYTSTDDTYGIYIDNFKVTYDVLK